MGITFQGLNMDIGHLRHMRWALDDDPRSAANAQQELTENGRPAAQNRWIAYNKMRGQCSSAMEHAVPEQYWLDKNQCRYTDENGVVKNPGQANCAEGISAVKALAIAQQQGQRIYTINQSNRDTALPKLSIGGEMGAEIRSAIQAGKEVIFHEDRIRANGWNGYGYVITDPETGAGGYIIEGRGNGSFLDLWKEYGNEIASILFVVGLIAAAASAGAFVTIILIAFGVFAAFMNSLVIRLTLIENGCGADSDGFFTSMEWLALALSLAKAGGAAAGAFFSFLSGNPALAAAPACRR